MGEGKRGSGRGVGVDYGAGFRALGVDNGVHGHDFGVLGSQCPFQVFSGQADGRQLVGPQVPHGAGGRQDEPVPFCSGTEVGVSGV